jgi:gamma-glutamylcyclotransferase (GGCT)/AIG2-like uncharacterized protein YtfP
VNNSRNLFVYGTLRRDTQHELVGLLARHARFVGDAAVGGKLYDLGNYPGLVYPGNSRVIGEVYAIDRPYWESVISQLDEYEGCTPSDPEPHEYRREVVPVQLTNGETLSAWAYVLNREPRNGREIQSGDYLSWRAKARA